MNIYEWVVTVFFLSALSFELGRIHCERQTRKRFDELLSYDDEDGDG